jgi:hypothetical protein
MDILMTTADLIHRWNALQQAIRTDAFRSVKIRYAITKNTQRLANALEAYRKALAELHDEYDIEDGEDRPLDFVEERQELLEMEEDCPAYTVSADYLDDESDVPYELLGALMWMIEDDDE